MIYLIILFTLALSITSGICSAAQQDNDNKQLCTIYVLKTSVQKALVEQRLRNIGLNDCLNDQPLYLYTEPTTARILQDLNTSDIKLENVVEVPGKKNTFAIIRIYEPKNKSKNIGVLLKPLPLTWKTKFEKYGEIDKPEMRTAEKAQADKLVAGYVVHHVSQELDHLCQDLAKYKFDNNFYMDGSAEQVLGRLKAAIKVAQFKLKTVELNVKIFNPLMTLSLFFIAQKFIHTQEILKSKIVQLVKAEKDALLHFFSSTPCEYAKTQKTFNDFLQTVKDILPDDESKALLTDLTLPSERPKLNKSYPNLTTNPTIDPINPDPLNQSDTSNTSSTNSINNPTLSYGTLALVGGIAITVLATYLYYKHSISNTPSAPNKPEPSNQLHHLPATT